MNETVWTLGFEIDIQDIYDRLDRRSEGTGDTFYIDDLRTMKVLQFNPLLGRRVCGSRVRRILVHNRNYGMLYTVEATRIILHCLLDLVRQAQSNKTN